MVDYNKMMEAIRERIEGLSEQASTIRQNLKDGEYDDIPLVEVAEDVVRRVSDVTDEVVGAGRRIKDGYDGLDIWNLGDRLVLRLADFIDESIVTESYLCIEDETNVAELREMSDTFRAYALSEGGGDMLWRLSAFKDENGKRLLDDVYDTARERFLVAWNRFAEVYLVSDVMPTDVHITAIDAITRRLAGRPDATNLCEARIFELRRIVAMLRKFCENGFGYPYGYGGDESPYKTLVQHEDGWEDGPIPLEVQFWGNKESIGDAETVGDADKGYVAYICDIVEVSEVFDAWADWLDGTLRGFDSDDPTYAAMDVLRRSGHEEMFQEVDERLREGFLRTWDWFGTTVMSVWM